MTHDYTYFRETMKRLRRHEASPFNALFWDKEKVSEEYVKAALENVAAFFDMPIPQFHLQCESLVKMITSPEAKDCELFYNLQESYDKGINNKDAVTLCLVHEMGHVVLRDTRFFIFSNELWVQELACDILAGAYAKQFDLATGKYKSVIDKVISPTHPSGAMRIKAVEFGYENGFDSEQGKKVPLMNRIFRLVPSFVYQRMAELSREWKYVKSLDWDKIYINPPEPEPRRIEDLPDTNLIKQAVLRLREEKGNQQKEQNK